MGVPEDHVEGKIELGAWIDEQLEEYADGTMPEFHRRKLEEVPLWRWPTKPKSKSEKRK